MWTFVILLMGIAIGYRYAHKIGTNTITATLRAAGILPRVAANTITFKDTLAHIPVVWKGESKLLCLASSKLEGRWNVTAILKRGPMTTSLPLVVLVQMGITTVIGLPSTAAQLDATGILVIMHASPDDGSEPHILDFNADTPIVLKPPTPIAFTALD